MIILKNHFSKLIFIFSFLLFLGCVSSPEVSVEVLPKYERLFENKNGWTGADGAYSLPLSNTSVLWLFGDTWIGEIVNGEHVNAIIVNNSIAIQRGRAPPEASIEFFFPRKPSKDGQAFIQSADGRGWLWIYHGALTQQGLYLFLVQIERVEKPPGAGFRVIGSWLGHVANPGDAPMAWKITQYRIPWGSFSSSAATLFGSWVLQQGHWLYIYGTTEDVIDGIHHKYMILARVPESGLKDFDQWRFYGNGKWSTDFTSAERLCGDMANEFSVSFLPALGRYIVVYSDGGSSKKHCRPVCSESLGTLE